MSLLSFGEKQAESIIENTIPKLKTPFFGTFVFVWLIRNKIFIYDLFFNSEIANKKSILIENLNYCAWSFWLRLLEIFGITLIVLGIFYLFLTVSRFITTVSEDNWKLYIYEKFSNSRVSNKSEFERIKKLYEREVSLRSNAESFVRTIKEERIKEKGYVKNYENAIDDILKKLEASFGKVNLIATPLTKSGTEETKYQEGVNQVLARLRELKSLIKPSDHIKE